MPEKLKPCPFCGTNLQEFPKVMCVHRAYNEDYLKWLHENKKFVGSDRDYQVSCIKCGSTGARGATEVIAISNWNRRADNAEKIP